MAIDRVSCAMVAQDLDEELAGTAVETTGWIAIEHAGPWTPRAPTTAELGRVAAHLDELVDVRVQLIRPVREPHVDQPRRRGHTVLLGHAAADPARRWLRELHVERIEALLDLDPLVTLGPEPLHLGQPVEGDVWLLCTHARRDACCAVRGRPAALALELAGATVWETTHTGGHRFAATGIVLPDGLSLGRLDTVDIVALAEQFASGDLDAELLRGRCAVPGPEQAAEVALRRQTGLTGRDDILPLGLDPVGRILLSAGPARYAATVHSTPATQERPVSDDGTLKRPTQHQVTSLVLLT